MSSKKDKYLESAQKFIVKGQLDRAIKDYEQVVALDPGDIRHRQRLAELLVRVNRKEEAINEYETIGKHYAGNDYYLKAIAVYKQIQKLDPDNIKISLNLATLNEKQGLTGNAIEEYGRVYNHYDRSGKRADAVAILEKMVAIDPDNLTTRLKFAETSFAAGNKDAAYQDFVKLAHSLATRGDESAFRQVRDRVDYLFAGKREFALDLAVLQLQGGDAASAMAGLREITEKDRDNLRAWQLLADALRAAGERQELKTVLQEMIRRFPAELSPREGVIQCALDDGDADNALLFLKLHAPLFLEKGSFDSIERPYLSLLDCMPEDSRLLHGLKSLYEASGEKAKLAGIVARLDALNLQNGEGVTLPQEGGISLSGGEAISPELPLEPVREETSGEELDILLAEEGFDGPDVEAAEAAPEQPDSPAFDNEALSDEAEEVALELELSEDALADLAELYGHAGTDEPCPPGLPREQGEESAVADLTDGGVAAMADSIDGDGGLLFDGVSFSEEDECIELEGELVAEPEAELVAEPEAELVAEPEAELVAEPEAEHCPFFPDYDKYSLDGLFSAFKKGLDQQLDEEDTETHYNLGIAYKEMGLYDDAIAEFRAAAADPGRKLDCTILRGICSRDKGDLTGAEEIFREGIALTGLTVEELSQLKYELAFLYDTAGREDEAIRLYCEINALNPGFRDTVQRIEKIAGLHDEEEQEYYELDLIELDEAE